MNPLRVAVLAYPGCFASEVYGVPDLLTMATHVAVAKGMSRTAYDACLVSPRRRVHASGGSRMDVSPLREVDLLVVPGFEVSPGTDLDRVLGSLAPEAAAIAAHAASGTPVVSICVGAFLLGEAGLLSNRRATTSWLFADQLARRYDDVEVLADQLVVTDAGVTTTAAFSAMYDFALDLIRDREGPEVARATARIAIVDDSRATQTPYVDTGMLPAAGERFSDEVRRWLHQNLSTGYDLNVIARTMHVSPRTLLRRFRAQTGQTPLAYLHGARVGRARHLLETTERTVASIATEVGYHDAGSFSQIFSRHTGQPPRDYRARFRRTGTQRRAAAR
jgi:transcriptional regulator GlxA family with amidase domain